MLENGHSYENVSFRGADLSHLSVNEAVFYRCTFTACLFQYADLVDCDFQECTFLGCNLSLASFVNSRIIDTEFNNSKLLGINWGTAGPVISAEYNNCLMDNCAFSGMNLTRVKFESCSLVDAAFSDTKLTKVKMADCDFAGCQFHQSDLSRADFSSSRNYFINAETNKLHKTKFSLPEAASLLANLDIELCD